MIHICVAWMAKGKLRHDVEMILFIETYLATMWLAPALIRNKLAVCLLNKLVLRFTARNTLWVLPIMACTSVLLTKTYTFPIENLEVITAWLNRVRQADVFDDFSKLSSELKKNLSYTYLATFKFTYHIHDTHMSINQSSNQLSCLETNTSSYFYTAVLTLDNSVVDLDAIEALYENVSILPYWEFT